MRRHRTTDPTVAGRWSALPAAEPDSTLRAHYQAELLLDRHGVLTRGAVAAENVPGGFAHAVQGADRVRGRRAVPARLLRRIAWRGAVRDVASTVDRLRTYADGIDSVDPERPEYHAVVLAASDPANPYGAALPWPVRDADGAPAGPQSRGAGGARRRRAGLVRRTRRPVTAEFHRRPTGRTTPRRRRLPTW